jgi:Tfp pilus assembly protein PilN
VKAVNLIPGDSRSRSTRNSRIPFGPTQVFLVLLAVAVGLVTVYVLTNNTIKERRVKVVQLQRQVSQEQAVATRLANYANFVRLAQKRIQTVRQIASTRFDWYSALRDLSRVVPANTSLQSLTASVAPGDAAGNGATPGSTAVRGDITAPAFEMVGCTQTQDDVARLMSRLRLINGVTRVTLEDSQKQAGAQGGTSVSSASATSTGAGRGCGGNTPSFDLVVFFTPLPGEAAAAAAANGTAPPPSTTTSTTSSTTSTTSTGSATPIASTTTSATTTGSSP